MLICLKFICIFKYVICRDGLTKSGRAVQEKKEGQLSSYYPDLLLKILRYGCKF